MKMKRIYIEGAKKYWGMVENGSCLEVGIR